MNKNNFKNIPFMPHSHGCINCTNRQNPQFCFNSTILTISIIAISFVVSFALNQALKETFEQMFPKSDQLGAKWSYAYVISFSAIIIIFLLMYNLNGSKW